MSVPVIILAAGGHAKGISLEEAAEVAGMSMEVLRSGVLNGNLGN